MKLVKYLFIILYTSLFLYVVFFAARRRHQDFRVVNMVPLGTIVDGFKQSDFRDRREIINYFSNLLGNMLLFIPYTFIVVIWTKYRNTLLLVFSVVILSAGIEIVQYIFEIGVSDIDDILLNTAGGCTGIFCFRALRKRLEPGKPNH